MLKECNGGGCPVALIQRGRALLGKKLFAGAPEFLVTPLNGAGPPN